MRHRKQGRKLGRTSGHRRALRRNLTLSLFIHERITTTPAKAKEARRTAERMITIAKNGTLHSRRRAMAFLQDRDIVDKLFDDIAPRYKGRNGGYTRILHLDKNRLGDKAPQVIFELVGGEEEPSTKRKAAPKAEKAAEEPKAQAAPPEAAPKKEDEPPKQAPDTKQEPENASGEKKSE